jgi:hypothetical protein
MSGNLQENQNIVVHEDVEIELKISVEKNTIWLIQKQIAELFDKDVKTINEHIKAIYKDEELFENSTIRNFRIVQKEGVRKASRDISHYNLDVIISIGYRINSKKITHQRFKELESNVNTLKTKVSNINVLAEQNSLQIKQCIFYDEQIFDAYVFINDLLKSAKKEIILIDNYVDETVLVIFSKYPNISFIIVTKSIFKPLKVDIEKYIKQYDNLIVKASNKYHDRFLIIDNVTAYHISASLKDLAKRDDK